MNKNHTVIRTLAILLIMICGFFVYKTGQAQESPVAEDNSSDAAYKQLISEDAARLNADQNASVTDEKARQKELDDSRAADPYQMQAPAVSNDMSQPPNANSETRSPPGSLPAQNQ